MTKNNDLQLQVENDGVRTDYMDKIQDMIDEDYREFIKAIVSIEKKVDNPELLDEIYEEYMERNDMMLLHDSFDIIIENSELNQQIIRFDDELEL